MGAPDTIPLHCPHGCDVEWDTPRSGPDRTTTCWMCGGQARIRPSMADKNKSDEIPRRVLTGRGVPDHALTGDGTKAA